MKGGWTLMNPIIDLSACSAIEAGALIRKGDITSTEATRFCQQRIEEAEPHVHAFINHDPECARSSTLAADRLLSAGNEGSSPIIGVPMGLKDNICTTEMPTTCGSKMLEGYQSPYDATAWAKLRSAGAVLLGKLNMDEFAMGSTSETSYFGSVSNPFDSNRIAGGSSGGPAAAVASGEVFYALGSDTGGSVRQPAAYCGVTGFKPTYGAVSRYGLVAYASSLDQIGPIATDAISCAAIFAHIIGQDGFDSTACASQVINLTTVRQFQIQGLRIGLPDALFGSGLDPQVKALVLAAATQYEQAGAIVEPVLIEGTDLAIPAYYVIACAEAASNLSRYDGVKYGYRPPHATDLADLYTRSRSEGFGTEVKRRLLLGNFVLSSGFFDAYYRRAVKARELIGEALAKAFTRFDVILCPTTPDTAPLLGTSQSDPLTLYLKDLYTVIPNLAGLPAISLPCGFSEDGLPVGMQLIGRKGSDQSLLGIAHAYQQMTTHHLRRPESRNNLQHKGYGSEKGHGAVKGVQQS
jgi:aspartyl-tRNA(Asn)/glutamyl-tRNA(Gln) amidotransferase subunit A